MDDYDKEMLARQYNHDDRIYDGAMEYLMAGLLGKPVGGKSTVIMPGGTYVIDENFNPPRVTKIEDKEEENGRRN